MVTRHIINNLGILHDIQDMDGNVEMRDETAIKTQKLGTMEVSMVFDWM